MAINVVLVFYFRTPPDSFRRWWWLYCLICYGGPFIIALSLLLIRASPKGLVYGDAVVRSTTPIRFVLPTAITSGGLTRCARYGAG